MASVCDSVLTLTPISAAYSFAVSPLSRHRSTRFAHSDRVLQSYDRRLSQELGFLPCPCSWLALNAVRRRVFVHGGEFDPNTILKGGFLVGDRA